MFVEINGLRWNLLGENHACAPLEILVNGRYSFGRCWVDCRETLGCMPVRSTDSVNVDNQLSDREPMGNSDLQLDAKVKQALIDAINDEYQARAFYQAVIKKFGNVRPFSNIVQAESRHAQRLETIFQQYDLSIPEDKFADRVEAPKTLREACEIGVKAEIENVKMYNNFLEFIQQEDLRAVFTQLRYISQNNHKAAFERCLQRHFGNGF